MQCTRREVDCSGRDKATRVAVNLHYVLTSHWYETDKTYEIQVTINKHYKLSAQRHLIIREIYGTGAKISVCT